MNAVNRDYSRYKALRRYPWQVVNKTGVFNFGFILLPFLLTIG